MEVSTIAKKMNKTLQFHGIGRRKTAVARAWLRLGKGALEVNGRDFKDYFDTEASLLAAIAPLKAYAKSQHYDVKINVKGGGLSGQADAVKLAIARALLEIDENMRPLLRQNGFLTSDSRVKERKKYGQKAARRKFQFVKR
ncbi:MAG: 30S ribosomal protein S9 [Candidatus Babeliaceae bacterium]